MPTIDAPPMAKRGRKPSDKPNPSLMIRAKQETAEIVALVARARGVTSAELLERIFRPILLEQYAEVYPLIVTQRAEDDAAAVAGGEAASPPLPDPLVPHPKSGELVRVSQLHATTPKKKPKG